MMIASTLNRRLVLKRAAQLRERTGSLAQDLPALPRFAIAGAAGYLVYQAVLLLVLAAAPPLPRPDVHIPPLTTINAHLLVASLLAAEASIITVFCIHRWWTFRARAGNRSWVSRLLQFHAKSAISTFGIVTVGVHVLNGRLGVEPAVAATLTTLLAFGWNWVWDSRVIWSRPSPKGLSGPRLSVTS